MNEIYWLTRLTSIHTVFVVLLVISSCIFTICFVGYLANYTEEYESEKKWKKLCENWIKKCIIFISIGILGISLVPTTKEALLIWGVGSTIDYLKQNPTARQLPDKCIYALDKWVDSLANDSIEETKEKK